MIRGKRIVVVDDSIVRGNTQRRRSGCSARPGAPEVHVRISSPPVKWPCFYGIDFATRAELIATGLDVDEIRASVGADSLGYTREGMIGATDQQADRLCRPASPASTHRLPDQRLLGKHLLETLPLDGPHRPRPLGRRRGGVSLGVGLGGRERPAAPDPASCVRTQPPASRGRWPTVSGSSITSITSLPLSPSATCRKYSSS